MSDESRTKKEPKSGEGFSKKIVSTTQTYRAEFRKIVWPSRETLIKHTVTVIAVSLIFGAYIALVDGGFGVVLSRFVELVT